MESEVSNYALHDPVGDRDKYSPIYVPVNTDTSKIKIIRHILKKSYRNLIKAKTNESKLVEKALGPV